MSLSDRILLPTGVKPVIYHLELTPNLTEFTFNGKLEIDYVVTVSSVKTIILHCKDIIITSASIGDQNATDIIYDEKLSTVSLTFNDTLGLGPSISPLVIIYKGILNDNMAGFYRSKYSDADGKEQYMASTQFEALDARRALPCWDEPAVKAIFEVLTDIYVSYTKSFFLFCLSTS